MAAPVATIDNRTLRINEWGQLKPWLTYFDADGGGPHTGPRGLFRDPPLVGVAEPSSMAFTRPRHDRLFSVGRGIRPGT
jgi:hypothetical protein